MSILSFEVNLTVAYLASVEVYLPVGSQVLMPMLVTSHVVIAFPFIACIEVHRAV